MEPSIWQLVTAIFMMTMSIWFIAFGVGMFIEATKDEKNFLLCFFLTAIGALCFCISMSTLMMEAIKLVGPLS